MSVERWLTLALLALVAAGSGCREHDTPAAAPAEHASHESSEQRVTLSPEALAGAAITTVPVERRLSTDELRATAVIKPNENRLAHVSPRIPGKAIEVTAVLGDLVAPAQPLALLDSLELGEKKSAFLQARTNLEVARRTYEREARLFQERVSSEKDYLAAKGDFERGEAAYRAAREALRLVGLADADIEGVTWGGGKDHPLSHFPLLAPFAGTVVEKHITIGELIEPNETPYTIADLTTVWVLLDIYEKDLAHVAIGAAARITVEAYPTETFRGTVAYLSNLLDAATRTAQARVEIDNHDGRLRPGMFATAAIVVPSPGNPPVLVVPHDAVQQIHNQPVAFVAAGDGTYVARPLTLGKETGADITVLTGLAEGEHVVTMGGFYLKSSLLKGELGDAD